jgi:hypothetical protein
MNILEAQKILVAARCKMMHNFDRASSFDSVAVSNAETVAPGTSQQDDEPLSHKVCLRLRRIRRTV